MKRILRERKIEWVREHTTPLISTFIASLEWQRDISFSNYKAANMTIIALWYSLRGKSTHTLSHMHTPPCTHSGPLCINSDSRKAFLFYIIIILSMSRGQKMGFNIAHPAL